MSCFAQMREQHTPSTDEEEGHILWILSELVVDKGVYTNVIRLADF